MHTLDGGSERYFAPKLVTASLLFLPCIAWQHPVNMQASLPAYSWGQVQGQYGYLELKLLHSLRPNAIRCGCSHVVGAQLLVGKGHTLVWALSKFGDLLHAGQCSSLWFSLLHSSSQQKGSLFALCYGGCTLLSRVPFWDLKICGGWCFET